MEIASWLQELSGASLFELYRLQETLHRMIDDPVKIAGVKARLRIGMKISYFDPSENRLVEATVLELHRTHVLVQNIANQQRWSVHYASVNVERVNVDTPPTAGKSDRAAWKVGDSVAFRDKQNRDLYGTIISLNPKTASVLLKNNQKWRVAYSLLIPVWEGNRDSQGPDSSVLPMWEKTLKVIEACPPEEAR